MYITYIEENSQFMKKKEKVNDQINKNHSIEINKYIDE